MTIFLQDGDLEIREATLAEAIAVEAQIPEFSGSKLAQQAARLDGVESLILLAFWAGEAAGYKVGYAVGNQEFYSWLGGVLPPNRRRGLADRLRRTQEAWAAAHGYKTVLVKSSNRFPAMLQLLLAAGYQIIGYEDRGDPLTSKIAFRRQLTLPQLEPASDDT